MTDSAEPQQPKPRPAHQFQPGQSGNPAGRALGSRNKATVAIDALLEGESEAIAQKAVDLAKAGDPVALRLVLERIAPVRRGRPVRFDLPPIENATDVVKGLGAVLQATAAGDMSPEEASTIASVLEVKRKAIELVELEGRLAAVEKRLTENAA